MGFRVLCMNKADIGEFGSPYSYEFEKLLQGIFDNKGYRARTIYMLMKFKML